MFPRGPIKENILSDGRDKYIGTKFFLSLFYRGAIEGSEMVMSVDWAEESIHTVPLPTQLVILPIVRSKSRPLIGQ